MLRLLADENLDGRLVRGLARHYPQIDCLRIQETDAFQRDDAVVLELAAREGRVLVTHDIATMPVYAMERVAAARPMPGVIVLSREGRIAAMLFEIALVVLSSDPAELRDRVIHLRMP